MDAPETEPLLDQTSKKQQDELKEHSNAWSRKDGALGWTVAMAIMLINFIIIGLGRMAGILYMEFMRTYHVDRGYASAPLSVQHACRNLFGPVVGILGHKFGIRSVTALGGLIGVASAVACAFADNITWITIFWGGFYGASIAFTSTLSQIILDEYFERDLSSASGLSFAGGSIGAMVFALILQQTIDDFGLKNTYIIMGACLVLVLPLSFTLTNAPWTQDEGDDVETPVKRNSFAELSADRSGELAVDYKILNREFTEESIKFSSDPESNFKTESASSFQSKNDENKQNAMKNSNQISPNKFNDSNHESGLNLVCSYLKHMKLILKLYQNPAYLIISMCRVVHLFTFMGVLTFIIDFSMDRGLKESDGRYAIASISLGDLLGRLFTGWITDFKFVKLETFMMLAMVLIGLISISLPFVPPSLILILICLYSILEGSTFIRHPVLVSKYTKPSERTIGMGFMTLFSGLLGFVLPTYIGHFRDDIGSYNQVFYINGGACIAIGLCWSSETWLRKFVQ